jgi:uncharacterized protein (DUF2062 family)
MRKLYRAVTIIAPCIAIVSWSVGAWLQATIPSQPDHPTEQYTRLSHFQGEIHYTTPIQELGTILSVVGFFGAAIIFIVVGFSHGLAEINRRERARIQSEASPEGKGNENSN